METLEPTQLVPTSNDVEQSLLQQYAEVVRQFEDSKAKCEASDAIANELIQVKFPTHLMMSISVTKRCNEVLDRQNRIVDMLKSVVERTDQEIQHVQKSKIAKSHSRGNIGATLFYLYVAKCGSLTYGRHSFSCINFVEEHGATYILVSYTWLHLVELLYTQGKILLDKVKFPAKWKTTVSSELRRLGAEEHKGDEWTTFFPILESCKGKRNRVFKVLFSHLLPNMRVAYEGRSGLVRANASWTLSQVPEAFLECDTSLDTLCKLLLHRSYRDRKSVV